MFRLLWQTKCSLPNNWKTIRNSNCEQCCIFRAKKFNKVIKRAVSLRGGFSCKNVHDPVFPLEQHSIGMTIYNDHTFVTLPIHHKLPGGSINLMTTGLVY